MEDENQIAAKRERLAEQEQQQKLKSLQ